MDLGFVASGVSGDGVQHRWRRGEAALDVLIPEGMGERAEKRPSASGFPTVATPGGTQALHRSESVEVRVGTRSGHVLRPTLVGTLILKAAARLETTTGERDRHTQDFATLLAMLGASDLRDEKFSPSDRRRLRRMIPVMRQSEGALRAAPGAQDRLARLEEMLG